MGYESPDRLPASILQPLMRAEDLVARLDERASHSACAQGFLARQHFADAVAALWIEGELVHAEELVLHDGRMDARAPTHEITRAHDVLRIRRRIAGRAPGWALSAAGLAALRRSEGEGRAVAVSPEFSSGAGPAGTTGAEPAEGDALSRELAEIDSLLARAGRALADAKRTDPAEPEGGFHAAAAPWPLPASDPDAGHAEISPPAFDLLRDPDHDEDALLERFRARVLQAEGEGLPPVLAAFLAWDAWEEIKPLERQHWLGNLLAAALLRRLGKARAHLPALAVGLRDVPRGKRRSPDRATRCLAFFAALANAAEAGTREIDRLELAAAQMERRLRNKRRHSHLPHLAELVLSRPVVTTSLIAAELKVTQRAALNLIGELGVREISGRGRYRVWGIL